MCPFLAFETLTQVKGMEAEYVIKTVGWCFETKKKGRWRRIAATNLLSLLPRMTTGSTASASSGGRDNRLHLWTDAYTHLEDRGWNTVIFGPSDFFGAVRPHGGQTSTMKQNIYTLNKKIAPRMQQHQQQQRTHTPRQRVNYGHFRTKWFFWGSSIAWMTNVNHEKKTNGQQSAPGMLQRQQQTTNKKVGHRERFWNSRKTGQSATCELSSPKKRHFLEFGARICHISILELRVVHHRFCGLRHQ